MSFNIYSYRSKGSPNNKNSQKILRGFGKSSWILDTEYLPWDSKETYHEDYRLIRKLSKKFTKYKWDKNAGYGTKHHLRAIKKFGVTIYHRKTFGPIHNILSPNKIT